MRSQFPWRFGGPCKLPSGPLSTFPGVLLPCRPGARGPPPSAPTPAPAPVPAPSPAPAAAAAPTVPPPTLPANNTFALAQQRLIARRQARETENAARLAAQRSESQLRSRIAASQSPLIRRLGSSTLSFWDAISSREGTRPAFRVGQVDAELLDAELVDLLRTQVGDALKYIGGGVSSTLKDEWDAEILLILRAILFKLTIWDHDATYGAALQNLRYTDARKSGPVLQPPSKLQKSLYGFVTVGGKYLWTKWETYLLDHDEASSYSVEGPNPNIQRLSRLTESIGTFHAFASFASFLVFLLHGRYRTILDRLLRMRLAPPTSQVSREVSFEYLNRQLVWHAFTEFLLFVLPLVGINRWRRWLARTWRRTKSMLTTSSTNDPTQNKGGEFAFLPERTCAICYQDQNSAKSEAELMAAASSSSGVVGSAQTDITNPYEAMPCGCVYCFVCVATRIEREEGEGWTCLRCGELVKECKPWNGDVLSPAEAHAAAANQGGRNVAFAAGVKERPNLNRLSTESSGRRSSSNRVSFDDEVRERRRVSFEDEIRPGEDAASDDGPVRVPERRESQKQSQTARVVGTGVSEGETSGTKADEEEEGEDEEKEGEDEEDQEEEEEESQLSGDLQTSSDAEDEEDDGEEEEEGSESGSDSSDSEDYEAEEEELGEDIAFSS
ncbi:Pex12 amino terminal region domain-containing protein [Neurospora intermedia]|uniref:Pex12 amino terminal region domain-containing protein n=1 Tax=Neurospora intermedia TaxID=5142 RepID=A0ABR3CYA7_NEUIN